jgi:hypothetical protein
MAAKPHPPVNATAWASERDAWKAVLQAKVFRGWPEDVAPEMVLRGEETSGGRRLVCYEFTSQHDVPLRLYVLLGDTTRQPSGARLTVADEATWQNWIRGWAEVFPRTLRDELAAMDPRPAAHASERGSLTNNEVQVWFAPRGIGLSAWAKDGPKNTQIRRRFMLLGQTVDGMRVWDIRRAIQALRSLNEIGRLPLSVESEGSMAVNTLYAAQFEPDIKALRLSALPRSHREGPDYLNVLRFLDIPQIVAMAAESTEVELERAVAADWQFPSAVASGLNWSTNQLRIFANRMW